MKICGIICEYNPLHNGHEKHIAYARAVSRCDYLICVMSGAFVQRGQPALLDKFTRARHAVYAGADMVLELPLWGVLGGADDFAACGMGILKAIGASSLSFGCETSDFSLLHQAASQLLSPSEAQKKRLSSLLSEGLSYPAALSRANEKYSAIFEFPNNTLAVAYIKAAAAIDYQPEFYPLQRCGSYHSLSIEPDNPSSTSIRNALIEKKSEALSSSIPAYVLADLDEFLNPALYDSFLYSYVQTLTAQYLSTVNGMTEGLENRIIRCATTGNSQEFLSAIKTKRYTMTRIKRTLASAVLGYTKQLSLLAKKTTPYSKVLAVKESSLNALMRLYSQSGLSCAPSTPKRKSDDARLQLLQLDIRSADLFSSLCGKSGGRDYTLPLQVVK